MGDGINTERKPADDNNPLSRELGGKHMGDFLAVPRWSTSPYDCDSWTTLFGQHTTVKDGLRRACNMNQWREVLMLIRGSSIDFHRICVKKC